MKAERMNGVCGKMKGMVGVMARERAGWSDATSCGEQRVAAWGAFGPR